MEQAGSLDELQRLVPRSWESSTSGSRAQNHGVDGLDRSMCRVQPG